MSAGRFGFADSGMGRWSSQGKWQADAAALPRRLQEPQRVGHLLRPASGRRRLALKFLIVSRAMLEQVVLRDVQAGVTWVGTPVWA